GCPALVVHDLCDREVPWEEGERYARFWPGARLLSTHGLGHNRIVDDPAVIGTALAFLRGDTVGERVVSTTALPYGIAWTARRGALPAAAASDYPAGPRRGHAVAPSPTARGRIHAADASLDDDRNRNRTARRPGPPRQPATCRRRTRRRAIHPAGHRARVARQPRRSPRRHRQRRLRRGIGGARRATHAGAQRSGRA